MPESQHPWDAVAAELSDWLQTEPEYLADALLYRGRSPFAGQATERQKLDYYRRTLNNPDGSPNEQARADLLRRAGIQGYTAVLGALAKDTGPGIPEGDTTEGQPDGVRGTDSSA